MTYRNAGEVFALKPLVLAIMAALPLLAQSQVGVRLPAVPANAVPVPAASWRVGGSGGAAPTYTPNTTPQRSDAVVTQSELRAIYQWQSFDIGAASSLTYRFGTADGSALNRVVGSAAPSQILGRLASTVPGPNGTAVTGGTVMLINQNGILFGPKSQVNTGALIASTLNVGNDDFLVGFNNTLQSDASTFKYEGGPELFADGSSLNFVRVDPGAVIENVRAAGGSFCSRRTSTTPARSARRVARRCWRRVVRSFSTTRWWRSSTPPKSTPRCRRCAACWWKWRERRAGSATPARSRCRAATPRWSAWR